eukprot:CAMPEP_0170590498 /NCGR_PEP_ID=MMETSP0224-20130122/11904_1 /TAXON_ID=285029 /ORGANISM="Togula jolla, Strain CCCM 725" /LENGTH=78 /DNA_ID=CAMNT_0010914303 /DNA_START=78 /DNA_END=311 /DNA_ORIENTATION=+
MSPSSKMLLATLAFLAGASASVSSSASCNKEGDARDLVLLQMEAQRIEATSSALRQAHKPSGTQAPDITAKLAKMNET